MEVEKKTIAITYDDASRMMDFCKDEKKSVSKDFYDWYLLENTFFCKSGVIVMDMKGDNIREFATINGESKKDEQNGLKKSGRFAIVFNAENPDNVLFEIYQYGSPYAICRFSFNRQENITMDKVNFNMTYYSELNYKKSGQILLSEDIVTRIEKIEKEVRYYVKKKVVGINKKEYINKNKIIKEQCSAIIKGALNENCRILIYSLYSLMYYVSKQSPEEVASIFKSNINKDGIKVNSTYKYTGYIDLRDNKTYKPLIKKDPNELPREYGRHIQKWTVRGHYRRTKSGMIWIEPHTKGEGELEKRIYGTEDEKSLNLIPKVFEVTRTVYDNKQPDKTVTSKIKATNVSENIITPTNKKAKVFKKLTTVWAKIISFLTSKK